MDFSVARGLSKTQFLELAQGQWVQDGLHLIVVGSTGVGKTFWPLYWATQLCQQGQPVRYFKTAELLLEWKLAKADGSFPKFQKQLAAYSLLILDDWLREPCSANDARELLDLLDDRYRRRLVSLPHSCQLTSGISRFQIRRSRTPSWTASFMTPWRLSLQGESMRKLTSKLKSPSETA